MINDVLVDSQFGDDHLTFGHLKDSLYLLGHHGHLLTQNNSLSLARNYLTTNDDLYLIELRNPNPNPTVP